MFYSMHVRVGNEIRVGYFFLSFKKPFWVGRDVVGYMNRPKHLNIIRKARDPAFTPESDRDAWTI